MYIGIFVCLKLPVCQTTGRIFPPFFYANTFVAPKIVILIILTPLKYIILERFCTFQIGITSLIKYMTLFTK